MTKCQVARTEQRPVTKVEQQQACSQVVGRGRAANRLALAEELGLHAEDTTVDRVGDRENVKLGALLEEPQFAQAARESIHHVQMWFCERLMQSDVVSSRFCKLRLGAHFL